MENASTEDMQRELRKRHMEEAAEFLAKHSGYDAERIPYDKGLISGSLREIKEALEPEIKNLRGRAEEIHRQRHQLERVIERAEECTQELYHWETNCWY